MYIPRSRYKLLTPLGEVMWPAGSLVTFFGILILLVNEGGAADEDEDLERDAIPGRKCIVR